MTAQEALLHATPAGALLAAAQGVSAPWSQAKPADVAATVAATMDAIGRDAAVIPRAEGALATVAATFAFLTSVEQLVSAPLAAVPFPLLPALRVTDIAIGLPHAHAHPPNLTPPNPVPIPLPSAGPVIPIPFVSGAAKTLIDGLPAARCGDFGLGIWCGGYVPLFEVFLGSSKVWIEGARAARSFVDVTTHCVFSARKGPNDQPLGPFVGTTITGSPKVRIGGVPMPSLVSLAMGAAFQGLFRGLGKLVRRTQASRAAARIARRRAARGYSGARFIDEADPKLARVYDDIVKATDDVPRIARSTGISQDVIEQVKKHLFLTEHEVPIGPGSTRRGYFTPDEQVADLWPKATNGTLNPDELSQFRRLVAHEYVESRLMEAGMPYRSAHPDAYPARYGGEINTPTPQHHGAHDLAPLVDHQRPPFAHWPTTLGRDPPPIQIADDLSNLDDVVTIAQKGAP
ncbi:PAAR domain-containing protein [Sorangium sp. So ce118]